MNFSNFQNNVLATIRGQFSPKQFGARLFMSHEDLVESENYLVWFHERFHYLQSIFTPYGHLKWGAYRTVTSDILTAWLELPTQLGCKHKIPIREYFNDRTLNSLKIAYTIESQDALFQIYNVLENNHVGPLWSTINPDFTKENLCPVVEIMGAPYELSGRDIFESFAKFEEAMMAELISGISLDTTIDPSKLNSEYYSALYYFIEKLGVERIKEFPIICELSLATPRLPSPSDVNLFRDNSPSWRFIKIIDTLSTAETLPDIDFNDNDSFYTYSNTVLSLCGYSTLDHIWDSSEKYALQADLTMAQEMVAAIDYKKSHPWMLSYPMSSEDFISDKFNRFEPYYTITDDAIKYNIEHVSPAELILENNYQALASQICGKISPYCIDTAKLMCGDAYMGTKACSELECGKCDGHIDKDSSLPKLVMDENHNIKSGCYLELLLNIMGTSIREIDIGTIKAVSCTELISAFNALKASTEESLSSSQ